MSVLTQVGPLARRSIKRLVRSPPILMSGLIFPVFIYTFNIGGLDLATRLPGFPTESYPTFALSLTFAFCGIYAVLVAGSQLGEDIGTGYVKRVALTPLSSGVLLFGQLAGIVGFALIQGTLFILIGLATGASIEAGVGGALVIVGFCGLYALAFGCVGLMIAMLTRSGEAVQGLYPLTTSLLFLSSASLPRELIQTDWFQTLTTYNPVSYMVEAPRSLMIEGWEAKPLLLGVGVAVGLLLTALAQTARSMRTMSVAR